MERLCVDIGGSHSRIACIDDEGRILKKDRFNTPDHFESLVETIHGWLNCEEKRDRIGISIAGAFSPHTQRMWIPNAFFGESLPTRKELEKALSAKIIIADDRIAGSVGEGWKGKAQGERDYLYLIIGTGLGLGIVIDGKPVAGEHGLAGSIAWNKMRSQPLVLERILSGPGLIEQYQIRSGKSLEHPQALFDLSNQQTDPDASWVVTQFAHYLGEVLGQLTNLLDPSVIVLAGSVSSQWPYIEEESKNALSHQLSPQLSIPCG